jgi:hypothetical protein
VTEGNAAAIPDNGGGAVGAVSSGAVSGGAVGADDAVDTVVGVIGTASDGDAGVVFTYY